MKVVLENIRQKPESHKRAAAFGLSLVLTFVIGLSWIGQKRIFGGEDNIVKSQKIESKKQIASAPTASSPIENSKKSINSGLSEVRKVFDDFKNSLADVLVPFITGIEVYERK